MVSCGRTLPHELTQYAYCMSWTCHTLSLLLGKRSAAGDTPKDSRVRVEMIPLEHGPSFQL